MAGRRSDDHLLVFILTKDSACGECKEELGRGRWVTLQGERGALCLSCADLDHLEFLGAGDAAVTRRARRRSRLSAVVLTWSRARKRYERQGLLVESSALEQAEAECLSDAEARARRREREAERRAAIDAEYVRQFTAAIRKQFPHCPPATADAIAAHACVKYSQRVGRSAAAKAFDPAAIRLAAAAHVRHVHTDYDELLGRGLDRSEARAGVAKQVREILHRWEGNPSP
jgi:hypothetical protein